MSSIDGIRSFEGLRKRGKALPVGNVRILVAALPDILKSKRAAGRPQDLAVLRLLEDSVAEASSHSQSDPESPKSGK
jgi:hypothetical protein